MRNLLLLGSTGSIGTQCLDIVDQAPDRFRIVGLSAMASWQALVAQAQQRGILWVALLDADAAAQARAALPSSVTVFGGPEANLELIAATSFDIAVNGIVGAAGLVPSRAVLERQKRLALANKESLVIAGRELMELARDRGAELIPVDSEHSALMKCLAGNQLADVRKVYLTASGGALRDWPLERLSEVTRADALAHPNWDMGPRITVGSATLMNKALEIIEAAHLWQLPAERIGVLLHRQSIVHGLVEFHDGSVMAEMSPPDMRGPIYHALEWPERAPTPLVGFDPVAFASLTFELPDMERFPTLDLGYRCVREGGNAGAVLNAADEVATEAFLAGQLAFTEIVPLITQALDARAAWPTGMIEQQLAADQAAREFTRHKIQQIHSGSAR